MLRWLKTVVVSDEEKAHEMRQAGTRKTTAVEASKLLDDIRTGAMVCAPG
jgi:protein required for attachment to host cells